MKIEKMKPGMVVYDVHRHKMGNTTITTVGVWSVGIVEVDVEKQIVTARWNGNPAKKFYRGEWSKWREKEPLLIRGSFGQRRLATREEIAEHKAKKEAPHA